MLSSIDVEAFRTPEDLVIEPSPPRRIIIVGSCLAEAWSTILDKNEQPCEVLALFYRLPLYRSSPSVRSKITTSSCCNFRCVSSYRTARSVDCRIGKSRCMKICSPFALRSSRASSNTRCAGTETTGSSPSSCRLSCRKQNLMGRLMPRHDLRNPVYFVEKLNERLEAMINDFRNCYYFEFNEVVASFGRRLILEDQIMTFNHGSFMFDFDFIHDQQRLEPVRPATEMFDAEVDLVLHRGVARAGGDVSDRQAAGSGQARRLRSRRHVVAGRRGRGRRRSVRHQRRLAEGAVGGLPLLEAQRHVARHHQQERREPGSGDLGRHLQRDARDRRFRDAADQLGAEGSEHGGDPVRRERPSPAACCTSTTIPSSARR